MKKFVSALLACAMVFSLAAVEEIPEMPEIPAMPVTTTPVAQEDRMGAISNPLP